MEHESRILGISQSLARPSYSSVAGIWSRPRDCRVARRSGAARPIRHLLEAFPSVSELIIDMGNVTYSHSNPDHYERFSLAALTVLREPRRILEIGTYDGATTRPLARAVPDAEVLTLDLPPSRG
jgi:hypothetical protein